MQETTPTTQPATLRQRLAALLLAARIYTKAHWRPLVVAGLALVFVLLIAFWPAVEKAPEAEQPAAQQTNPLAPLVARIEALEEQVADLQEAPVAAAPRAGARRTPAAAATEPAAPAPQAQQEPTAQPWGTTDLDRAITLYKPVAPNPFADTTGDQK